MLMGRTDVEIGTPHQHPNVDPLLPPVVTVEKRGTGTLRVLSGRSEETGVGWPLSVRPNVPMGLGMS